ncbi:hypothetical protein LPJ59_003999, partial [Coemansia sp. RSA 2399]
AAVRLAPTVRRLTTKDKAEESTATPTKKRLTFLQPQVDKLGIWREWAYDPSDANAQQSKYRPLDSAWTLAERRALFMYHRALAVSVQREPDWDHVARRLDRDPASCKFAAMHMTFRWASHMERKWGNQRAYFFNNVVAGIGVGQLRQMVSQKKKKGDDDYPAEVEGIDAHTCKWLRKLVAKPSDPALWGQRIVGMTIRTDYEKRMLEDVCPVWRLPRKDDLAVYSDHWGTPFPVVLRCFRRILDAELDARTTKKPLDAMELAAIDAAEKACWPREVTWGDVGHSLKPRTFAQVALLTTGYRRGMVW